jgi:hypothetical protein
LRRTKPTPANNEASVDGCFAAIGRSSVIAPLSIAASNQNPAISA